MPDIGDRTIGNNADTLGPHLGRERGESAFGVLLRRYRLGAGLSQEALAERAELSVDAISSLERGLRRAPYAATVELLAAALELGRAEREALAAAVNRRRTARTIPHPPARVSLPLPLTRLIGRDRELALIRSLMTAPSTRLLSITGVGGVGKSRFALELAHGIAGEFEDGAAFVALAAIRDPAHIPAALARSLEPGNDDSPTSLDALCARIADQRVLVLIDNFEQVLSGAPLVSEFLSRCPRAAILVTSREALRVGGEHEFSLQPLDLDGALELLIDRAQTIRPDLEPAAHREALVSICRRLEGLPLAIELAAARLRHYPVAALLERLSSRLAVLVSGSRDSPPRLQTMRSAIDWSYQLLTDAERTLFQIGSLFAGGGTLEALATVASATGCLEADFTDELVNSLADKHLISLPESAGHIRFAMLETIREYAHEQLVACGRLESCGRPFAEYYAELAHRAAPHLLGPDAPSWLDSIAREYENVRATLRWAIAHDRSLGLALALNIRNFWKRRGYFAEPCDWLEALVDPLDRTIAREEPRMQWQVVNLLALSHHWAGHDARARVLYTELLRIARALDDPSLVARSLNNYGSALLSAGEFEQARRVLEESLALKLRHDDDWSIATTLSNLGMVLRACGEYQPALERQRRALDLFRSTGDRWGEFAGLNDIADIYRDMQAHVEAARFYKASLEANADGIKPLVADSFEGLAAVAAGRGRFHHVAVLGGAADAIHRETGRPIALPDHPPFDAACSAARAALGAGAFDEAWAEGTALPLAEGLQIARAIATDLAR